MERDGLGRLRRAEQNGMPPGLQFERRLLRRAATDDAQTGTRVAYHSARHDEADPDRRAPFTSMRSEAFNTTVLFYPNKNPKLRLFALWYFTILMIVWNVLGHTVLGFEQSWATPLVAVGTA